MRMLLELKSQLPPFLLQRVGICCSDSFFSGGKGQPIRVISLHCLVSELVGKVTLFQTITGEKNQNNLIPSLSKVDLMRFWGREG